MKPLPFAYGLAAFAALAVSVSAHAAPTVDHNVGFWLDAYDDSFGIADEDAELDGFFGREGIQHDVFGRVVKLDGSDAGYWFTTPIQPSSFQGWTAVYVDYTASTLGQVKLEVWDATVPGAEELIAALPIGASDLVGYAGKASLAGTVIPSGVSAVRLRVALDMAGSPIGPTVSALRVTWKPKSVLAASLEAPGVRSAGDAIQVRFPVSVSYVNAQSFVAFVTAVGIDNNGYAQAADLSFGGATLGGTFNPGPAPVVVNGVSVPPQSIYWSLPSQTAGKTYAYNATFYSRNGLVNGLSYRFVGNVHAANAATVATAVRTTTLTSAPSPSIDRSLGGAYYIGGVYYVDTSAGAPPITYTVSPVNWRGGFGAGAQAYFAGIVYEDVSQWRTGWTTAPTITSVGGTLVDVDTQVTTARGTVTVPANSIYWNVADLAPGARADFQYQVAVHGAGRPNVTTCATLQTRQAAEPPPNNLCAGGCAPVSACTNVVIGILDDADWGFSKGDVINGYASVSPFEDNSNRFITWGQAGNYRMYVANSGASALNDLVVYDRMPAGVSFVSAQMPATQGQIYYWQGGDQPQHPELFGADPTTDAHFTAPFSGWATTPPAGGPTWVAYHIKKLRSPFFNGTEATSANLELTVQTAANDPNACVNGSIVNTAVARLYRYTPLGQAVQLLGDNGIASSVQSETIEVRTLVPAVRVIGGGSGSVEPGQTATATFSVVNASTAGNAVDTARNVVLELRIPTVVANGEETPLAVTAISSGGGTIDLDLPDRVSIYWNAIVPNGSRSVTLTYLLPLGIANRSTFTTGANVSADDDCGQVKASGSSQTAIASEAELFVEKAVDFRVVGDDSPVTYTLTYRNSGTAPSTHTWVTDRIAEGTTLIAARAPYNGQVWFSDDAPPFDVNAPLTGGLPATLLPSFPMDDAVIRAHFTPGDEPDLDGWVWAPDGTKWVAWLVDDSDYALFPSGVPGDVQAMIEVDDDTPTGALVVNEAAITADAYEQSIGNRVSFLISDDPGVQVSKTCADVVSVGEPLVYTILFRNDTTNPDDTVTIIDTLPADLVLDADPFRFEPFEPSDEAFEVLADGRLRYTWTFNNLFAADGEGAITVSGRVRAGVQSGTFVSNEVIATAENLEGTSAVFDECTTLVENADLVPTKLVDQPAPKSDEIVQYTVTVVNENQRAAESVVVRDVLPGGLAYVGGSLTVLSPGWSAVSPDPGEGAHTLTFRFARDGFANGTIPGRATVAFTYRALVASDVPPGTDLVNTVSVTTPTGEDDLTNNTTSLTVTTPLPDVYVTTSATPLVKFGDPVQWTLLYGNDAREDASNTFLAFSLPQAPVNDGSEVPDFQFVSLTAPEGVVVWYSDAPLDARPTISNDPGAPGGGWSQAAPANPSHLLFVVTHCDASTACDVGDIHGLLGPFEIQINGVAAKPDGSTPPIGQPFEVCADIMMRGVPPPLEGGDGINNHSCATTRTPGIDLAVEVTCEPDGLLPGHTPGDQATFAVTFENTGTQPAFGISFDVALASQLGFELDDAEVVLLTDSAGQSVAPIDQFEQRIESQVRWTRVGSRYVLGAPDSYTNVGLAPGDVGHLTIAARVNAEVLNNTSYENVVLADVQGRPGDADEEYQGPGSNNEGRCGSTVYRADVFVIKSVKNVSGDDEDLADGGDVLEFTIEYGNAGRFAASDVIMSDALNQGLTFVSDSVANLPAGSLFEYDDGSGAWTYQPTGAADPNVRAVRVRYDESVMGAPANAVFTQTSVNDFDRGVYSNTFADDEVQGVLPEDGLACAAVQCYDEPQLQPLAAGRGAGSNTMLGGPYQYCETQGYVPEDACCQFCCPTPAEREFCLADLEDEIGDWEWCMENEPPEQCGERPTREMCEPPECDYEPQRCWAPWDGAPNDCDAGTYAVTGQCNGNCCPAGEPGTAAYDEWYWDCDNRYYNAWWEWYDCTYGSGQYNPECGNAPEWTCSGVPAGCSLASEGQYESPLFPAKDEGNVLAWGNFIAHVVLGEEGVVIEPEPDPRRGTDGAAGIDGNETNSTMYVELFGVDEDGAEDLLKRFPMQDGENVHDISDIDPSEYPELYMRAYFLSNGAGNDTNNTDGNETCGMRDIADGAENEWNFFGAPTDMNGENQAVGFVHSYWGYWDWMYTCGTFWHESGAYTYSDCVAEDANHTAWAWDGFGGDDTVANGLHDLHEKLPGGGYQWVGSEATDINDRGDIVGWAIPRESYYDANDIDMRFNQCIWYPQHYEGECEGGTCNQDVTEATAIVWRPTGNGSYSAECLPPLPNPEDAPALDTFEYELETKVVNMYLNERGWVAGTVHAHELDEWKSMNDNGVSIGRAAVWCPADGKWQVTGFGPGIVNDMSENAVLMSAWVAQSEDPEQPNYELEPVVLEVADIDAIGCPKLAPRRLVDSVDEDWEGFDSNNIYAIEINEAGHVLTMRDDPSWDGEHWIFDRWVPTGTGKYFVETLADSYEEYYEVPQTLDGDFFDRAARYANWGNAMAPNGDVYLMGEVYGNDDWWNGILHWPIGEDFGQTVDTGLGDDFDDERVLGVADGAIVGSAEDSDDEPFIGSRAHDDFKSLGMLDTEADHSALHVDEAGLHVVGVWRGQNQDAKLGGFVEQQWRVFVWEECPRNEYPQLLDWTVTYQTDKNPSWTFQAELDDACRTSITNDAEVTTSTPEITLDNNSSSTSISVNTADIALELEVDKAVVEPGETLYYTGTIRNDGPGTAREADVRFALPNGGDFEALHCADGDAWFIDELDFDDDSFFDGSELFASFGELELGAQYQFEGYCTVVEGTTAGVVLVSSVAVSAPTIDCVKANNDPTAVAIVGEFPNLYVDIEGPSSIPSGRLVTYGVTFGNNGNFGADAEVTVDVPDGFVFVEALDDDQHVVVDNGDGTITIRPFGAPGNEVQDYIAAGDEGVVELVFMTPGCAGADLTYDLFAVIETDADEAFINDNQATTSTLVTQPLGMLSLVSEVNVPRAEIGQEVVYTVHYANTGGETVYDPALTVTLPTGLTLVSAQPVYPTKLGRRLSTGVHVLLPGDFGATVVRALVTGTVSGTGSVAMNATNGACAITAQLPPVTTVPAAHGVEVLVSTDVGSHCPAERSKSVGWTVSVTNTSDTAQADVLVQVPLPAELELVSGSMVPAGSGASSVLVWTVDVPARGIVNLGFRTRVKIDAPQGLLALTATAGDATGRGGLALQCHARAVIDKAWSAGCAVTGQNVGVTLTVRNASTTIIRGAQLVDRVPKGMVAVAPTDGSYTVTAGVVTFPIVELLPGQSRDFTFGLVMGAPTVLPYGSPIVNRALLLTDDVVIAASNQLGTALADCNDSDFCTVDSCETFAGCVGTFTARPGVPELCNGLDDDCDTAFDEDDEDLVLDPCEDQDGVCQGALHPARLCQGLAGWAMCDTAAYDAHDVRYDTLDTTCDGIDNDCSAVDDDDYVRLETQCGVGACRATGLTSCVDAQVVDDCTPGAPTAELCDSIDNDCDNLLDGADIDLVLKLCEKQGGVCLGSRAPRTLCVGGAWLPCTDQVYAGFAFPNYATSDATCDGLDNDCDSTSGSPRIDEEYVAPATSCGVGECADNTGVMACATGELDDTCDPLAGAVAERCNGLDDDCDALTDETFPGLGQGCDPNPNDGNQCKNGTLQCRPDGSGTQCVGGDVVTERCDAIDNDCDGQTDEGCDDDLDDWCDGEMVCITGIDIPACPQGCGDCNDARLTQNPGATESCNNIDDDCDGQTDEGCDDDGDDWCDAGMGCTPVVGVCNKGCGDCVDTNAAINPAAQETCNNIDDDCDTRIDEGYGVGEECTAGEGACEADGLTVCNAAGNGVTCDAIPAETDPEVCNGDDDDCDGEVDEGYGTGAPCVVGLGECRRTGTLVCADVQQTRCSVQPGAPTQEVCDGKDNNCNGQTDESPQNPEASVCSALDTVIDSGPAAVTSQTTATFTFHDPVTPTNTQFECSLDGDAWVECDNGTWSVSGLEPGAHTLLVRALGPDGGVDPTPAIHAWVIDTDVPDTFIDVKPQNPSQTGDATFVFSANIPEAEVDAYWCVLDPAATPPAPAEYEECTKLKVYAGLDEGPHDMWVYVVNTAGTKDPTPAHYRWVIDTTLPDTEITRSPVDPTKATSAVFEYQDPEAPGTTTFQCRLDGGAWERCDGKTRTYTNLGPGEHVFEVATIDPNGNIDPSPSVYIWTVDTDPPDTFIPTHPDNPSQNPTAVFGFDSDESPVTYKCVLDGPRNPPLLSDYVDCDVAETYTGLADGFHRIVVYAIDEAGNADPTPAVYEWIIDTTFPETQILTGPPTLTGQQASATFTYRDPVTPSNQHFECSLDDGEWVTCDGGTTTYAPAELGLGGHELQVRTCVSVPLVQCDPTPAIWVWEVTTSTCPLDQQGPVMTCAASPVVECEDGIGAIGLGSFLPTATDACTPVEISTAHEGDFALGTTPVVWVAVDGNGNRSTCVTSVIVTDTAAPSATCGNDIEVSTPTIGCAAAIELEPPAALDACTPAAGLLTYNDAPPLFPVGDTTVTWTVVDPAGNSTSCSLGVTVVDDVPLEIECLESFEQEAPADACAWTGTVPATATDNCALDSTTLDQTKAWAVGSTQVDFSAADKSGNTGSCSTALTVRDVTDPVPLCGEPVGAPGVVPQVVRATATDACGVEVAISGWSCERVDEQGNATPVGEAECPVGVLGAELSVDGRFPDAMLRVKYTVEAVDPSENVATLDCVLEYDPDKDDDGVINSVDNCVDTWNADQADGDDDGVGDVCDVCPAIADAGQVDADGDGFGDVCDNCAADANEDQGDFDGDEVGNACDVCADVPDPDQVDGDANGIGDQCQDTDEDGSLDIEDNCVAIPNEDQADIDLDELGDACDDEPYEGLVAEGSGSCAGGEANLVGLLLAALALVMMRRRASSKVR